MLESIPRKMFVAVVVIIVLVKTNPTLEQHHRALYCDGYFSMWSHAEPSARRFFPRDAASAGVAGRPLPGFEPHIEWHDYKICSAVTAGNLFGIRRSFGILGHVFVLPTVANRAAQEEQAQRANQQELAKIIESMGKPWFRSVPKIQFGGDYSARGCVVERDDKP